MNVILLAAGQSKRMGKINKLLLPLNGTTLVANSAMQALQFLENTNESSNLIVVTGYRHFATEKALKPCKDYIEKTNGKISMTIVYNKDFRKGQFTSVKTGVRQLNENEDFFITLSDLPKINHMHYKQLFDKQNNNIVRPVVNNIPGHPVLLTANMKQRILKAKTNSRVSNLLKTEEVFVYKTTDPAFITDIDTPQSLD